MAKGADTTVGGVTAAERLGTDRTDRAPIVQQSRARTARHQKAIVDAARRLITANGGSFTTQELIGEAGIALQTFYRHFAGKDQLLLAVIEDMIEEAAAALAVQSAALSDPVARLRFSITSLLESVADGSVAAGTAQFVTSEHWRLHQLFPDEMARATQPIVDLFARDLQAATDAGLLQSVDPQRDGWFTMRLVMSVFHHYAFVGSDEHAATIADDLWSFCIAGFRVRG